MIPTLRRSPCPAAGRDAAAPLSRPSRLAALGLAALGTAALCATPLAAQDRNRFVPQDSCFVLRIAAPAKWRSHFAKTQVAKLMDANSLAPLMEQAAQAFDAGMQELRDSGLFDADLARGLVEDYRGDIVVSVQLDWDRFAEAMQTGATPPMSFVVALTPDGAFDLAAVASEFERMVESQVDADAGDLRDLIAGDLTLRRSDNGGDEPDVTLPAVVDGHLVMLGGTRLEQDATRLLADERRFEKGADDAPLFLHMDLAPLLSAVFEAADEGDAPFAVSEMMTRMGFGAIEGLTLRVDADAEHVTGEMSIGLKARERGVFEMFPATDRAPRLLASVPPGTESFSVSTMTFRPLFGLARDVWTSLGDAAPMSFDDAMDGFTEMTKVRLEQDLIAHLGDEVLVVQDVEAVRSFDFDDLESDPAAMLAGTVYGIALRDGRAFDQSLETMLRARGLHVGRKREEYAGVQINSMRLLGLIEIECVVTDDLLLIAASGNEATRTALAGVLDTRAAGGVGVPDVVRQHTAAMAPGWNGIAVTPVAATFEGIVAALQASGEFGEEMDMVAQVVRAVGQDIRRLGIDSMVSATYVDDRRLVSRFRW